jgi:two-component system sensor histidine kinase KdpD
VPPDAAESIFEPFVQGGGPTRPGGVGLGLAIARRVVRAHGGRIWAESRPNGGFFAFTLPVPAPAALTAVDTASPEDEAPIPSGS